VHVGKIKGVIHSRHSPSAALTTLVPPSVSPVDNYFLDKSLPQIE
jgi:hypothetical protein